MENRTEPMQEQTWWKLHCASCLLVFCAVVWCCWCWLRSEWGKQKPSKPIHILTALFTTRIHKEKQILPYQPTSLKTLANTIYCMCLFQHGKQERNIEKLCKNKHGENCIAQVVCWYFVRLCGAAGVGCEVSDGQKPSKPIHILTALFTTRIHKENKQILPYQPTLLKTLVNIIHCMCFFQHNGKQNRTHARTNMVKIALRKLFAGILCGCVVLLVLVAKWVREKSIQTYPYSNCTFHHQNSQRKQTNFTVPTNLIENFGQHNPLHVFLSA